MKYIVRKHALHCDGYNFVVIDTQICENPTSIFDWQSCIICKCKIEEHANSIAKKLNGE